MTKKVAVLGFGYIGSVIGAVLANAGYEVHGIEQNERIINCVRNGEAPFNELNLDSCIKSALNKDSLTISKDYSSVVNCDVIIITVGTPLSDKGDADLSQISNAITSICPYLRDGQIVILKSTVPPRTTSALVAPMLKKFADVYLGFSPERLAEGKAVQELLSIPIVVGGINMQSTIKIKDFWESALNVDVICVESSTAAELVKLADNWWIDLNIAISNELAKLSDSLNLDVLDVISAANTLPKGSSFVNILTPSVGVGGYCLTKDPWFVRYYGADLGLDIRSPMISRTINDEMPIYCYNMVRKIMKNIELPPHKIKVAICGLAFKNNTGDCRFSPAIPFVKEFIKGGYDVVISDPWVSDEVILEQTGRHKSSIESALFGAHVVAFLAGHDEYKRMTPKEISKAVMPGALFFDGRFFASREYINDLKESGINYQGVGRN